MLCDCTTPGGHPCRLRKHSGEYQFHSHPCSYDSAFYSYYVLLMLFFGLTLVLVLDIVTSINTLRLSRSLSLNHRLSLIRSLSLTVILLLLLLSEKCSYSYSYHDYYCCVMLAAWLLLGAPGNQLTAPLRHRGGFAQGSKFKGLGLRAWAAWGLRMYGSHWIECSGMLSPKKLSSNSRRTLCLSEGGTRLSRVYHAKRPRKLKQRCPRRAHSSGRVYP